MHWIDWLVLLSVLLFIVAYGVFKTRKIKTAEEYLVGGRKTPWWMVGVSIMATQASAITFLSTPGQAFDDGLRFVQFYFGMPIAMVLLAVFVLPRYFKMNVYTAYEYLEGRFGRGTRTLTAVLFLVQRGLAAGITIYAPAIILTALMGWDLRLTCLLIGLLVIVYTLAGGTEAVTQTQKQQMIVIMTGMIIAFITIIKGFPQNFNFQDALHYSGQMGKLNAVTFDFDLNDRYNLWSGLLGGTFLFLSYFGTDQSQVQRYLQGRSLAEARMGLMFNGLFKIPMQFFILLIGVMVFVFFQFQQSPLHFNPTVEQAISQSEFVDEYNADKQDFDELFDDRNAEIQQWKTARENGNDEAEKASMIKLIALQNQESELRESVKGIAEKVDSNLETNDKDYVFIHYVLNFLPIGLIGLLLAVIFSAAMSSTSSELNALATTTVVDIYKPSFAPGISNTNYLRASKVFTALWGMLAIIFALSASLFENLIQAVNILGSLFYGTILGVFLVAFFVKKVGGRATFWAAVIMELAVILIFYLDHIGSIEIAYLWLNAIGAIGVVVIALILENLLPKKNS